VEAADFQEAQLEASRQALDLVLLHLSLPGFDGGRDLATLVEAYPAVKWMVFTDRPDDGEQGIELLKAGAAGYCNTYMAADLLVKSVEMVRTGEVWAGRKLIQRLIQDVAAVSRAQRAANKGQNLAGLTDREQEIAQLVADGASNKRIALRLDISERTVKAHLTAIFRKTGARDRLQLALLVNAGGGGAEPTG
jgi:two-component system nitrate/nitrite response regulator NarL